MLAVEDLAERFEEIHHVSVEVIPGSSGLLAAQIIQGAPYDAFLSADMSRPNEIDKRGMASQPPRPYAIGRLRLWFDTEDNRNGLEVLGSAEIVKIAIANPDLAPYGSAAIETLRNAGIYTAVEPKLVFGESVTQVNQFIFSGSADAGITSQTLIPMHTAETSLQFLDIDPATHSPIVQGVIALRESTHPFKESFLDFVLGREGQQILIEHGYGIPADQ